LTAAVLALLLGFVSLAVFAMNQFVWALIVLGGAYLASALVDDLFMTLLAPLPAAPKSDGKPAAAPDEAPAPPRTREQTALLLSGLCRIAIAFLALLLLLAPYGEGPLDLVRRSGKVADGLAIGGLTLRPLELLQGLAVLLLGLGAVRGLKGWLSTRYMPTTRMDAGMRSSATTLFGYMGTVLAIAASLTAMEFSLQSVAWVASALSVGIGFGLQSIVQNFVSGLILLAERPVKVGDWVSLSGVEGDIRRISVRSTEIQMGDRSTVIVPNSEFITKIVRNVTYGESLGMVQFKLPMPLATDIDRVKALVLASFEAHPGVLATPAPNVQLDGVDGTNLVLNASGFVNSPRAAYGIRSDLLFDVLARLRGEGLLPGQPSPAA
ncbi:mechanosensitive ion channel, partial [Mitsuaria sp. TWR114]|uniref:mechanosensitive ion channel family protein n=1 Tax=Mitsuaria sp. TWR114 TaxID=2601731 RepID=UPI0011BF5A83